MQSGGGGGLKDYHHPFGRLRAGSDTEGAESLRRGVDFGHRAGATTASGTLALPDRGACWLPDGGEAQSIHPTKDIGAGNPEAA
jgi:hypothetical protein